MSHGFFQLWTTSSMSLTLSQFGIARLDAQQRMELIGLIWNSLRDDAPYTPPNWHIQELERRIAAADANRGTAELPRSIGVARANITRR
jgi:putative addiction module component (TIGR02574 family)